MPRVLFAIGVLFLWSNVLSSSLVAQSPNEWVGRGPGFYLSIWKMLTIWLLFLCWVKSADWLSQDVQKYKLGYQKWNPIAFFSFIVVLLIVLLAPLVWVIGFPLLFVAYIAPLTTYVIVRNRHVIPSDRVFTRDHLQFVLSSKLRPLGVNIASERASPHEKGPPVKLTSLAGDTRQRSANEIMARQSPGFLPARGFVAEAIDQRAEAVMLDFTEQSAAVKYHVDGVWQAGQDYDRVEGDLVLDVLKALAGLKADERTARQSGAFGAEFRQVKHHCTLTTQGTKTGERVLVKIDSHFARGKRLPDIGLRAKVEEQFKELLETPPGMFVLAAPPGEGLSTLLEATIGSMDRFLRGFVAVEDAARSEIQVENVPVTHFNAQAGEGPDKVLPKLLREYPDVIAVPEPTNAETMKILCEQHDENRTVVVTARARESAEALLRLLALKAPPGKFAEVITAAICQRLVRKLCDSCKEAYTPSPQLLKQLGIPPDRIQALYRRPENREEVCLDCAGVGYRGRHALFELLVVDDAVRHALAKTPKIEVVRAAARKAGMKTVQEEGVLLLARGVTSLEELRRVLSEKPTS